ncbi:MAG: peptidylprolyl isomerase, partial [Anaerolineae bacterium]
ELDKIVSEEQARATVLEDLIAQILLSQAARAAGFEITESDLQSRLDALAARLGGAEALARWQSAHGYSEASFRTALKRAAEAAWMRDQIISAVPVTAEQVHLQQILVYNETTAQQLLEQLKNGADFNELAARADPLTHGELGWVPRGYLLDSQIEQAAFRLQPGEFSEVIATPAGFHILRVLEREANRPLSPDALLQLQEQALQDWLNQRRAQSQITLTP